MLKKGWDWAAEAARTGQPAEAAYGHEGEQAREVAKKRSQEALEEELEENAEGVELMLPPEVTKRIRMGSNESTSSKASSAGAGSTPRVAVPAGEGALASVSEETQEGGASEDGASGAEKS